MYDTRFRKWRVTKILKQDEKRRIAQGIANQYQSGSPNVTTKVSSKDLMKTMRWISSQRGTKYEPAGVISAHDNNEPASPKTMGLNSPLEQMPGQITPCFDQNDQPDDEHNASIEYLNLHLVCLTTESSGNGSPSIEGTPSLTSYSNTPEINMTPSPSPPNQSMDLKRTHPRTSPSSPLVNPENRIQELIFHNVQRYALNRLRHASLTPNSGEVLTYGASPTTGSFWSNITNGIYLLKIASKFPESRFRASTAFQEAKFLLPSVCSDGLSLEFLRGILATLSPANTTIEPSVRQDFLSSIANAAASSKDFGPLHPITVICDALQNDGGNRLISSLALHVILDVIREQSGSSSPAYYKMMTTIIKMTRRDGDLDMASQMANGVLNVALCECGEGSEQARSASIELAHILTKLGDHGRAMSVRMRAISLHQDQVMDSTTSTEGTPMQLYRNDALSMHTMEDIAEYYIRFGYTNEAMTWLLRAKTLAENINGNGAVSGHISDKLEKVLQGDLHGQVLDMS